MPSAYETKVRGEDSSLFKNHTGVFAAEDISIVSLIDVDLANTDVSFSGRCAHCKLRTTAKTDGRRAKRLVGDKFLIMLMHNLYHVLADRT